MSAFDGPYISPGDRVSFVTGNGPMQTRQISGVSYKSGVPSRLVPLTGWQQLVRRFTPVRWRKPRQVIPGTLPTVTLETNEPGSVVERAQKNIQNIQDAITTLEGNRHVW